MTARRYATPAAFKQGLEQRLRDSAPIGVNVARRRQLLVFDRFLARVVRVFGRAVILKGGLVLEVRLDRARTTKDVDLALRGSPEEALEKLQEAGRLDLDDFMRFEIQPDPNHPEIQNDGMKYNGLRFRAECKLAAKLYGQPFGVDVAFGDPVFGEPDVATLHDLLDFAGIEPPTVRIYPIETHIEEKLHAYTMPRPRPNSRVKDLPDLALLATVRPLDAALVRHALDQTFAYRRTHNLPASVPVPPSTWNDPYARIAIEDDLRWLTLAELTTAVQAFLDPVLASETGMWNPDAWTWATVF